MPQVDTDHFQQDAGSSQNQARYRIAGCQKKADSARYQQGQRHTTAPEWLPDQSFHDEVLLRKSFQTHSV